MYRALCFDLFNTLVNVGSVPLHVGKLTADVLGVDAAQWNQACFSDDHEICHPTVHYDVIRTLAHKLDSSIPLERIADATRQRQARFDYALTNHISTDTLDTLSTLRKRGYKIALISNASTAEVQAWPQSPLQALFDVAVFSCHVGMKKPDTAIYQHTAQRLGLETTQCVFIGDGGSNEHDGAHRSGMKPLWLTSHLSADTISRREADLHNKIAGSLSSITDLVSWLDL